MPRKILKDDNMQKLNIGDKVCIGNYFDDSEDEGIIEYDDILKELVIVGNCKTWNDQGSFRLSLKDFTKRRVKLVKVNG